MGVSPQHVTLSADAQTTLTFGEGYSRYRVTVLANPAVVYFNAKDVAIGAVSGNMDGNDVIPAVLASFEGPIKMSGVAKVRLRSAGTPTVSVSVW